MNLEIALPLFQDTTTYLKKASVVNIITIVTIIIWSFIGDQRQTTSEHLIYKNQQMDLAWVLAGFFWLWLAAGYSYGRSLNFLRKIDPCICLFNKYSLNAYCFLSIIAGSQNT